MVKSLQLSGPVSRQVAKPPAMSLVPPYNLGPHNTGGFPDRASLLRSIHRRQRIAWAYAIRLRMPLRSEAAVETAQRVNRLVMRG